tara:strand:+ start:140 stop:379 length:240 start_codon:yes stop_codon:yes gene_type:complete
MIIPVRCFTCGNVLASKYRKYQEEVKKNGGNNPVIISSETISDPKIIQTPERKALDKLQLVRYCCRRHMISQVDIINYL